VAGASAFSCPLALGRAAEPEPDIAIVPGTPRDARGTHPSTAALVVEVTDRSLGLDRELKAEVYARAAIADYWIVDLVNRVVEIHRDPISGARPPWRYRSVSVIRPGEHLAPLAAPTSTIAVNDLLR
jgi:Uma2 family endonuclease